MCHPVEVSAAIVDVQPLLSPDSAADEEDLLPMEDTWSGFSSSLSCQL
jgi:hypothetical protein